jgi:hypothetical protein
MGLANHQILLVQFIVSTIAWGWIVRALIAPALDRLDDRQALRWWIAPQMMRHVGMTMLVPHAGGVGLSPDFTKWLAIGDLATALLSILAFVLLGRPGRAGLVATAIATAVGLVDLIRNCIAGLQTRAPDHLASGWIVVAMIVPLMLVLHVATAARLVRVARARHAS